MSSTSSTSSTSSPSSTVTRNFKILLLGDGGVGKTSFIKHHLTGEFVKSYIATKKVNINSISFNTTRGDVVFNIWDFPGQGKFSNLEDNYYGAHAAIIMFDVTSRISYKSVPFWYNSIRKICPDIPVILCGNKVDCPVHKIKPKEIQFHLKNGLGYYNVSVKSEYNFKTPFLVIADRIQEMS